MPLTEKHRSAIYQHLAPEWGEDVTQGFLSQFPATEGEEPLTRDHLRADLADLRTEMAVLRGDMNSLGSRLAGLVIGAASVLAAIMAIASGIVIAVS